MTSSAFSLKAFHMLNTSLKSLMHLGEVGLGWGGGGGRGEGDWQCLKLLNASYLLANH